MKGEILYQCSTHIRKTIQQSKHIVLIRNMRIIMAYWKKLDDMNAEEENVDGLFDDVENKGLEMYR